jgi:hypothetical protein
MPTNADRKLKAFLCHAKEDKPTVRELYKQLNTEGWLDVWLDEIKLLPGQEWDIEIEKAVEQADVVIVCLSTKSVDKEGYVQKELRFVLNIADEKPEGTIFVIPLRLDDCAVPRRIRAWQYVDYFPKSKQAWAYQRLVESLKLRAGKTGVFIEKNVPIPNEKQSPTSSEKPPLSEQQKAELANYLKRQRETRVVRDKNTKKNFAVGAGVFAIVIVLLIVGMYAVNNLFTTEIPTKTLTMPTVTITSQVIVIVPVEITRTPLATITGVALKPLLVHRLSSNMSGEIGEIQSRHGLEIMRYCINSQYNIWLLVNLQDSYGWVALYDESRNPLVEIEGNKVAPSLRLPPIYKVDCPAK